VTTFQLLALRIVLGLHIPNLAEIRDLRAAGYRGWVRGSERRILPSAEGPVGEGWSPMDVSAFSAETWQVERDGELLPGEHEHRSEAIIASWSDASLLGRVAGPQMIAVMGRPPRGYAVVLVAGTTHGPARLASWDEMREATR